MLLFLLNNVKLMGKYTALQAGTQPFTTREELRELDKNNPLHFSVTRQIVMSLCKAKMIQDGYSIDDALNPKLLGDVKRNYAKDIMSLIKEGKSQEIFDIMKAGCVAIDNQLKTCLGEIKSLDEIITNEKYRNVVSMGYVFKDLHQEIKHLPNELQAQNKKDIDPIDKEQTLCITLEDKTRKSYIFTSGIVFSDGKNLKIKLSPELFRINKVILSPLIDEIAILIPSFSGAVSEALE